MEPLNLRVRFLLKIAPRTADDSSDQVLVTTSSHSTIH